MIAAYLALFMSSCAANNLSIRLGTWTENIQLVPEKQPQRIFITPEGHDLVLLSPSHDPQDRKLVPVKWSLHNSTVPEIRVSIVPRLAGSGVEFRYEYTVSNGRQAQESIISILLAIPGFAPGTEPAYLVDGRKGDHWLASVGSALVGRQVELDENILGRNVVWVSDWTEDLANDPSVNILPGRSKSGFVVDSSLVPGFTTAGVQSPGAFAEPPDYAMDQEIWRQVEQFRVSDYFQVTTLTFGPMFLPGAEPVEVLANYRLGLKRLSQCSGIRHNAAFLEEVSTLLNEPGIEARLGERLGQMKNQPGAPIELELMNCLRIVARAFADRAKGGRN